MKLGIVGSRSRNTLNDKDLIRKKILKLKPKELVSGGCMKGADRFAEELHTELDIDIRIFFPNLPFKGSGKSPEYYEMVEAYYARNKEIADHSDMLIALVSKDRKGGTENTIKHFLKNKDKSKLILL